MPISRRTVLGSTATALAAAPLAGAHLAAADSPPAAQDYGALPSKEECWEDLLYLSSLGTRYTGAPGHVKFVNFLADRLKACPGVQIFRDTYTLPRWEATGYSLSVTGPDGKKTGLHATASYPYSGKTGPEGVTGEIVDLGTTTRDDVSGTGNSLPVSIPADVKGKILFIRSPVNGFPFGADFKVWGGYVPGTTQPDRIQESIYQDRAAPNLDQFKKAGAAGVILSWVGVSDENAEGQYNPFSHRYADLPALWVGEKTGDRIKALAAQGAKATITLEATITPDTPTDTVYGILPGSSDEIILVHTHTDGPNAVEENGGISVVALAKYISNLPAGARKRSYLFTLTSGHMALAYVHSFKAFIPAHPDLMKRIVGALVIEHQGARSFIDRGDAYVPSGENQTTLVLTQSKTLAELQLKSCAGTLDDRMVAVNPYKHKYTGESEAVIEYGIPTIGIMAVPSYLLKDSPNCGIERLDPRLFRTQLENYTRILRTMDGMTREQLAGTAPLAG